jgi:hypothetical protein
MVSAFEAPATPRARAAFGDLPLFFEPNQGQVVPGVDFLARASGYTAFLKGSGAVLALPSRFPVDAGARATPKERATTRLHLIQLEFDGGDPAAAVEASGLLPGRSNYLIGKDPAGWRKHVPHFTHVRYRDVYPGVDVVWRGSGALEYDMVLSPGADPGAIRLAIKGHSKMRVDEDGSLNLELQGRSVVHRAPYVFQEIGGERKAISARFRLLDENIVGFEVGEYDRGFELTIDPLVLSYSTYVGGSASEEGKRVAVDDNGMAYITGYTYSVDFPATPGAPQGAILGTDDAYVVKVDPSKSGANSLVYATYIGSSDRDGGLGITVDSVGRAYVTGWTMGGDFPTTTDAFKPTFIPAPNEEDAFITALTTAGDGLYYSTFFGGDRDDAGYDIKLRGSNLIYLAGWTHSGPVFPTTANAYDTAGTFNSVFLSVLDRAAGALQYSTFIHGSGLDYPRALALDSTGMAYVTGLTRYGGFPTTANAFMQNEPADTASYSNNAGFLSVFDPSKSGAQSLIYSTYLSAGDAKDVDVGDDGHAYVVGETSSPNFPTTAGAFDTVCKDWVLDQWLTIDCADDAFVMRIDPLRSGSASLIYSTRLGGSAPESGYGIAVDREGNAYVTGDTISTDFPLKHPLSGIGATPDPTLNMLDSSYAFVAKLRHAGDRLIYSTLLGGSDTDSGRGIAIDGLGAMYVVGYTSSSDFPIRRGFDATLDGNSDAFLAKITYDPCGDPAEVVETPPDWEWEEPRCIEWDLNEWGFFTGVPRKCPPSGCPNCSPMMSRDIGGKVPEIMPPLYRELFDLAETYKDPRRLAKPAGRLALRLKAAPTGRYFTESMKTGVLRALGSIEDLEGGPDSAQKSDGGEAQKSTIVGSKAVLSKVVAAVNAIALDWKVPKIAVQKVEAGSFTSVDFGGVAWAAFRDVAKPGQASLELKSGMPARPGGYEPGWPVVTYRLGFTGELSKSGYADVSFYVGGIAFDGEVKDLRILAWNGKSYRPIPSKYDRARGVASGRIFFRPGYEYVELTVVQASICWPGFLRDAYRYFQIFGQ